MPSRPLDVLIVYVHPEPTSFTAALKDVAVETLQAEGHAVTVSDLYGQGFDPAPGRKDFTTIQDPDRFHYQSEQKYAAEHGGFAPDIALEQRRLLAADVLILAFPLWHFGPPAMLKGWFERVCALGVTSFDRRRFDQGLFAGRRAIMCLPTGGTPDRLSAEGEYGDILTVLHGVQRGVLEFLGFEALAPFVAYAAPRVSATARQDYLAAWRSRLLEATRDQTWLASLDASKAAAAAKAAFMEDSPWTVRD